MSKKFIWIPLAAVIVFTQSKASSKADPLSALVGHWEGSAKFADTRYSKAQSLTSAGDCNWSPQGSALVCETQIEDAHGKHVQLSIDVPNETGSGFTYYTITAGQKPYTGTLTIDGNIWIYGPPPEAATIYPVFRTTNNFSGDTETFKTEFTDDGTHWTTMLDGTQHRTRK